MSLFTIDGRSYTVGEVKLTRKSVLNADKLTRGVMLDGSEHIDVRSASYSYSVTVEPRAGFAADYDALYEDITAPITPRAVTLPYGQGTLAFDACVETASDELLRAGGTNKWRHLVIAFTPLGYPGEEPEARPRKPFGEVVGYDAF